MNQRLFKLKLAVMVAASSGVAFAMGSRPQGDDASAASRIRPVATVALSAPPSQGAPNGGEDLYRAVCHSCHDAGVSGAPKIGDKAAWAPRIGVGLEVLFRSVTVGKNAMPHRGGSVASDEDLIRAVVYIANQGGANFVAPPPGQKIPTEVRSGEQIAQTACLKCHETGEKGAPRIGDKSNWAQRGSKGLDALTTTVIRGHGNMPARGGLADLTDQEVKEAIAFLFRRIGSHID